MKRESTLTHIEHLTLTTGHTRSSPRSEVADDIVEVLKPLVASGAGVLGDTGWSFGVKYGPAPGSACFIIINGSHRIATSYVAWTPEGAAAVWPLAARMAGKTGADTPPSPPGRVPWLAVILMPDVINVSLNIIMEAGDLERCIAWTVIELQSEGGATDGPVRWRRAGNAGRKERSSPRRAGRTIH